MTVLQLRGPMGLRVLQWCHPMWGPRKEGKLLYPDHHLIRCTKSGFRPAQGAHDWQAVNRISSKLVSVPPLQKTAAKPYRYVFISQSFFVMVNNTLQYDTNNFGKERRK